MNIVKVSIILLFALIWMTNGAEHAEAKKEKQS